MKLLKLIYGVAILVLCASMLSSSPRAMNWEGHDDWLENEAHGRDLLLNLPRPLPDMAPSCHERQKRNRENPYEQRPVPGLNCFEPETSGSQQN